MLSSPWGTFLPVVLGTLHQSEIILTPSLRFVIPLQRRCQAFVTPPSVLQAKYSASLLPLRPAFFSPFFQSFFQSGFRLASTRVSACSRRLLAARFYGTLHRPCLRRPSHRVNSQHHSSAHLAALQSVPSPDVPVRHAELVRDSPQRVPAPHPVPHQSALGLFHRPRRRNNQLLSGFQPRPCPQVVGCRNRPWRHAVFLRNRGQRLPALHPVPPPTYPFVRRDTRDLPRKRFRCPLRQVQHKRRIVRRRHPQQRRVQRPQRGHVRVNRLRHQP